MLPLYAEKLVPTAEQNVAAARANHDVNKASFLDLAIAQRQLIDLREKRQEVLANALRRRAELERIIGSSIPVMTAPEEVPARPSR